MPESDPTVSEGRDTNAVVRILPSELIELYKHHFDLFLKGYALQLAVLAAVAGFAFDDGATKAQRIALLIFGAIVCVVCAIAWRVGITWRTRLSLALGEACGDRPLGSAVTHLAESILPIAFGSSLITSLACLICAFVPLPERPATSSKCACCVVVPVDK